MAILRPINECPFQDCKYNVHRTARLRINLYAHSYSLFSYFNTFTACKVVLGKLLEATWLSKGKSKFWWRHGSGTDGTIDTKVFGVNYDPHRTTPYHFGCNRISKGVVVGREIIWISRFSIFFIRSSLTGLEPERLNRLMPLKAQTTWFHAEQTLFRNTITSLEV